MLFSVPQFLLIFRKAAAGELQEDSGLHVLARLSEIDVSTEGVKGAKSFFEAKVRNPRLCGARGGEHPDPPAQGQGCRGVGQDPELAPGPCSPFVSLLGPQIGDAALMRGPDCVRSGLREVHSTPGSVHFHPGWGPFQLPPFSPRPTEPLPPKD